MEQKPPGSWYRVQLRTADFSYLKVSGSFPRPELGTQCVCCDRETPSRRSYDPSGDRIQADPVEIPLCPECESHVPQSSNAEQFLGAMCCVGGGLALYGIEGSWELSIAGIAVLVIVIGYILYRRAKRRHDAANGHHTGLELVASRGMFNLRTTNPRLARDVAANNGSLVHRAR